MADRWSWAAILADGSRICEASAGTFGAVNLTQCVAVELWPARGWRKRPIVVRVDPCAGQKAVFFRRRRKTVRLSLEGARLDGTATVAGWEGPTGAAYLVAGDDGRVTMMANVEAV